MPKQQQKMFISVLPGEQVEMVITAEDGSIQEYYVEMQHQIKTKGNIYLGVINNIDTNLQAAFVDYGEKRNGFLQIDEVHPEYYQGEHQPARGFRYPPLQKVLKVGQPVLVQVVKEPVAKKGGFMTTYLSLPGRYFVLTIGREQVGISRKIEEEKARETLRKVVEEHTLGPGLGLIARTASEGISKTALGKDIKYLKRLWTDVRKKGTVPGSPALIYQEINLASRAVRDYLTPAIKEIWVDDKQTAQKVTEMAALVFPRRTKLVRRYDEPAQSLWQRFGLEKAIEAVYAREVKLPGGGQLVFDSAEALTAVDINSGKASGKKNFRDMVLKTNVEAAEEIARQLRLKDIGGQVVIDFIEMKDKKHCQQVEKTLRAAVKSDRARIDVGKLSRFGLLEMVRQRLGSSALSVSSEVCPCCKGTGVRRNLEWQALQALKDIYRQLRQEDTHLLEYPCDVELAQYLSNTKRKKILEMEKEFDTDIDILIK